MPAENQHTRLATPAQGSLRAKKVTAHARRVSAPRSLPLLAVCLLGCTAMISGNEAGMRPGSSPASSGGGDSSAGGGSNPNTGTQASGAPKGVLVTDGDGPTRFKCDSTEHPPVDSLRALTTAQAKNAYSDLVAWALQDASAAPTVLAEIAGALPSLPDNVPAIPTNNDEVANLFPDGGWLRADQDVQLTRVRGYYTIGVALANALVTPARLGTVVGSCATDSDPSNDATCLTSFLKRFGARVLRRPITDDELAFLQGVYGSGTAADPAAYADVITVLLNMPDALYFVEHGSAPANGQPGTYTLGPYELASRLAFHVWDAPPDDELLSKAADGSLLTDDVYRKEVDRLFDDPRAHDAMRRFYRDYIQVNSVGGPRGTGGLNYHNVALRDSDPVFKAFAGTDLPSPDLQSHLVDDALSLLDYYTWTAPGTIHDVLTSELSFAKNQDVATLYGVPVWDGSSTPPSFADNSRPGLFTRAIFLAGGAGTSPILKGVYLRRYALCDVIGRPPPAAMNAMVVQSATQTTRQATETLTANAPCSGCHTAYLNPLGFATENFDGLGRARSQETIFNADATVAAMLPVDTHVTPHVFMSDDQTTTSNAAELMATIDASEKPAACLARNYFRYTFARFEDTTVDGCALEQVRATLDQGGHLVDMLKAVVLTPAFKQRTFE